MHTILITILVVLLLKILDKFLNYLIKKAAKNDKKWDDIVLEILQSGVQFLIGMISFRKK